MTKSELIKELSNIPEDANVILEFSYYGPCNCVEYCYCSSVIDTRNISSVKLRKDNTKHQSNGGDHIVISTTY